MLIIILTYLQGIYYTISLVFIYAAKKIELKSTIIFYERLKSEC